MKKLSVLISIALGLFLLPGLQAEGQKVRLRGIVTPPCPEVQPPRYNAGVRFADLYGDGNIAVQGSYNCNGAFIYDISNPDAPVLASWYNPGNNQQFLEAVVVGNRGYFGSGIGGGGVHIVDLSDPYHPVFLGVVDSSHGNGHNSIHEMMVYSQDGATYLVENFNAVANSPVKFINVTDPANPVFKWNYTPSDGGWVHAMHIRGNRMFTSEFNFSSPKGVVVVDISNLATHAPTETASIATDITNHSTWTSEDGNYLYSAREILDGDIRVYDIHNPASPLLVRTIKAGNLGLNAITPHNPVVMGNKLYVSWYQAGLQVFDISNPANPVRIGQYDTFPAQFAPTAEEINLLQTQSPWDIYCGNNLRNVSLPSTYDGAWAVYPFLGENKVLVGDVRLGLLIVDVTKASAPPKNVVSDFDGDGKTDLSVYTPSTGLWSAETSSNGNSNFLYWGLPSDVIVAGDYDGDGKSDFAVWRPSNGVWYVYGSTSGPMYVNFGLSGDIPVAADYDADGKTDIAVFRPSTGIWYIQQSTMGFKAIQWGVNGDKPMTGDYEGDGKVDIAVWRPSTGVWYVFPSSSSIPIYTYWGTNGDHPIWADFDGDLKSDFAVYRPSTGVWYVIKSTDNSFFAYNFGLAEDQPIPADYDGDGKADIAVYRPSTNVWYRINSSDSTFFSRVYGQSGDEVSPASVQPQ